MLLLSVSCGQRKKDVSYYEQMVDSIQKSEQLDMIRRQAGMYDSPIEAFFDTICSHSLPLRAAENNWNSVGTFTDVPSYLNECFDYPSSKELKAVSLPKIHHYSVLMLVEELDAILSPVVYLCTLDRNMTLVDRLCIYEQRDENRVDDFGKVYMEYYITSSYEITLMSYYLSHMSDTSELIQVRRYAINKEGRFEEMVVEL